MLGLLGLCAQTTPASNDYGKIGLSVIMPDNVEGLDDTQLSKLETKVTNIVTESGISASGYNQNFVIYPKFSISDIKVVEGGMQNIHVAECELSLFIKETETNVLFSSISVPVKGSAAKKDLSVTNAITKINPSDVAYQKFIEKGKKKIVQYYEQRCDGIISKADQLSKTNRWEEALSLCFSVPEEVPSCYDKAKKKGLEIYAKYKDIKCADQIRNFKSLKAANKYHDAIAVLTEVDPGSNCFKEVNGLLKSIEASVDQEDKKHWDLMMLQYKDKVKLEELRIEAVKTIGVAFAKNQPKAITYATLIK